MTASIWAVVTLSPKAKSVVTDRQALVRLPGPPVILKIHEGVNVQWLGSGRGLCCSHRLLLRESTPSQLHRQRREFKTGSRAGALILHVHKI